MTPGQTVHLITTQELQGNTDFKNKNKKHYNW